jgi:hypothetical protein
MYFCTAKKETLRIVPQQVLAMQLDTVQLTYPTAIKEHEYKSPFQQKKERIKSR